MHALHNQSRRLLAIHSLCGAARIAFILSAGVWMLFYYCKFRPLVFGASVIIPVATIFMPIESENSITFVSVTARRYCVVVLAARRLLSIANERSVRLSSGQQISCFPINKKAVASYSWLLFCFISFSLPSVTSMKNEFWFCAHME